MGQCHFIIVAKNCIYLERERKKIYEIIPMKASCYYHYYLIRYQSPLSLWAKIKCSTL